MIHFHIIIIMYARLFSNFVEFFSLELCIILNILCDSSLKQKNGINLDIKVGKTTQHLSVLIDKRETIDSVLPTKKVVVCSTLCIQLWNISQVYSHRWFKSLHCFVIFGQGTCHIQSRAAAPRLFLAHFHYTQLWICLEKIGPVLGPKHRFSSVRLSAKSGPKS